MNSSNKYDEGKATLMSTNCNNKPPVLEIKILLLVFLIDILLKNN